MEQWPERLEIGWWLWGWRPCMYIRTVVHFARTYTTCMVCITRGGYTKYRHLPLRPWAEMNARSRRAERTTQTPDTRHQTPDTGHSHMLGPADPCLWRTQMHVAYTYLLRRVGTTLHCTPRIYAEPYIPPCGSPGGGFPPPLPLSGVPPPWAWLPDAMRSSSPPHAEAT